MRQQIKIPLLNGSTWTVEADIVGDLAIHQSRKTPGELSVTHVPTFLTMRTVVPKELLKEKKLKALIKWAEKVQLGVPKDWLGLRKITAASVKEDPEYSKGLRDRVKAHCLSVKG